MASNIASDGLKDPTRIQRAKPEIDDLISAISVVTSNLENGDSLASDQLYRLREACDVLSSQLNERAPQIKYTENTAIKIAIDMGIFDSVSTSEQDEFTAEEIASATGADPVLVERIMRPLMLARLFSPTPSKRYRVNESAKQLTPGSYVRDMAIFTQEVAEFASLHLPEYLAKTQYQNPSRCDSSPFQSAFKTNDDFYTWLRNRPKLYSAFSGMMKALGDGGLRWVDIFPVSERFERCRGTDIENKLHVVDIGGGRGYNLKSLVDAVPDLHAELILQDVPEVLASATELHPDIAAMPHSFFDVQPVVGADVYVLTHVLHNWPDAECRQILGHIRAAMGVDSVLLIGDMVFPSGAVEVSMRAVTADMFMMMFFGAQERTESQFRELLHSVGLQVVNVWRSSASLDQEAVLEVKRVD